MSNSKADERIERARRGVAHFTATSELVLVIGEDGIVLHLSADWVNIFELPMASMVGNSFDEILAGSPMKIVETDSPSRIANHTGVFTPTPVRRKVSRLK